MFMTFFQQATYNQPFAIIIYPKHVGPIAIVLTIVSTFYKNLDLNHSNMF